MEYKTYDELIHLIAKFRSEHDDLKDEELDSLVKQTFKIDQSILRELDGWSDYQHIPSNMIVNKKEK